MRVAPKPPGLSRRRSRRLDWTIVGVAVAILIMFATPFWNHLADSVINRESTPSPAETASGSGPVARPPEGKAVPSSSIPPRDGCVDSQGSSASCGDRGALFLTAADPCTAAGAASAIAAPEGLNLDLTTTSLAAGRCAVGPGTTAQKAGANAADVQAVTTGSINSALTLCQEAPTSVHDVACTTAHRAEAVGAWTPWTRDAADRCTQAVGVFTGRTSNVPGDGIRPQIAQQQRAGKVFTRCFVVSTEPLVDTVFRIGGGQLPHAR